MSSKATPRARVLVRVDAVTAARAEAAALEVQRDDGKAYPVLTLVCAPTDRLACLAADHADATELAGGIYIDLKDGPRKLVDESPPIAPDVPGPGRSPLWEMPSIGARYHGPVHLPADSDVDDLPLAVEQWLSTVPRLETSAFEAAKKRWTDQSERMLYVATKVVDELPASVSADERSSVLKKLESLADLVRHPRDGGPHWDDPVYEQTERGGHELKPAHDFINETYRSVIDSCARIASSGSDRARSEHVQEELEGLGRQLSSQLPPRLAKARKLGLLGSSVAAAREELLPIAWDGWRRLGEDESLRPIANPSLVVLTALEEERENDRRHRAWRHQEVELSWLTPSQTPVLTSSFLGHTILRPALAREAES